MVPAHIIKKIKIHTHKLIIKTITVYYISKKKMLLPLAKICQQIIIKLTKYFHLNKIKLINAPTNRNNDCIIMYNKKNNKVIK